MTPPASSAARSGNEPRRLLLKILAGWILLSIACSLPVNPFTANNPFAASDLPTPAPTTTPESLPELMQQVPPTLVETRPLPGSQAGIDSGITFYFNQAMDRASVEAALQIEPPTGGSFEWRDDETVQFIPENIPAESTIQISLGASARAQNGLELAEPAALSFRTPGQLEMIEALPVPNSANVSPSAPIVATFNQPVVPLSAEDRSTPAGFYLDLETAGRGEWINTSTYIFYPEPALAGGVEYTAALNPELTATSGAELSANQQADYTWRFTTESPRLIDLVPAQRRDLPLDGPFELIFNQAMDTASVEQHLALIGPDGEAEPRSFEWKEGDTQLIFSPSVLLKRGSAYTLSLAADAQSVGGTPLGSLMQVDYTTVGKLELTRQEPGPAEQIELFMGYGMINLQFNAPLNEDSLEDHLRIEPAPDELYFYLDSDQRSVRISSQMQASTVYTLTVSKDLRDQWNQPLGEDLELIFVTAPASPNLTVPLLVYSGMYSRNALFMLPADAQLVAEATNLTALDISATPLDLQEFITMLDVHQEDFVPAGEPESWQQALALPSDRPQTIEVPLAADGITRPPGLYYFSITAPEWRTKEGSEVLQFGAVVSQTQILIKRSLSEVFVWVLDLETNQPVTGAAVRILDAAGEEKGTLVTASDGTGRTALDGVEYHERIYAVIGAPGEPEFSLATDVWSSGLNGWNFGLPSRLSDESQFGYVYTDRPIYLPGQTVYFRALLNLQENGRYSPVSYEQAEVKIWGEYSVVDNLQPLMAEMTLDVSQFGGVTGSYTLPEDAPPGVYNLRIAEAPNVYLSFKVAEYRKPEIDLQVEFSAERTVGQEEIEVTVDARYYFGAAAGDLPVTWTLYAEDEPVNLPGGYRVGALNLERAYRWYDGFGLGAAVLSEFGTTSPDGKLELQFSGSDLDKLLNTGNRRRLTLEVVTNSETELQVSSRATAVLSPSDFMIGVRPEAYTARSGAEIGFSILTVDLSEQPSGEHPLQARFQKVTWPDEDENELFSEPAKPVFTEVSSTDFQTGPDGRARLVFTPPNPGVYQLEIAGDEVVTQVLVWAGGEGSPVWPRLPDQHILLQADKTEYQPGETAQIFVPNPFGAGAQALVTVERMQVMRSEVLTATGPSLQFSIPLLPEDAPNIYVSVILTGTTSGGLPDFRAGYLELPVDPAGHFLKVGLVGSPVRSEPGGEVLFTLQVSDAEGKPVVGEFSLALVDKAALALADPNAPSIQEAYYSRQPLGVANSMALAAYTRRINLTSPEMGGRGGGDSSSSDIRTRFEDTAYWNGAFVTGADGRAEIRTTLPDNLTTWTALVRGIDHDVRVGEAEIEVVATKDLLVRPQSPRFLVAGDRIVLSANVHNNTADDLEVTARLAGAGFELDDPNQAEQEITIPAGGYQYVAWSGAAQPVDRIDLVFSAESGELRDAATPENGPLPVLKYIVPSTFGTAGVLDDAGEQLEVIALPRTFTPEGGSLKVELSPSLAGTILAELKTNRLYPSDFTEAVLSSFLPNVQSLQALRGLGYASPELEAELEREIREGIAALEQMQNEDGGWGMTSAMESEPSISSYILFGLAHAESAGQTVDEQTLERARSYLLTNMTVPDAGTKADVLDRLAFQNFALQQAGVQDPALQRLYEFRDDMNPWAQGLLALSLAGNDPQDARGREILIDLKDAVRRSATGVHWEQSSPYFDLFSTQNFNTAVVTYTLARLDPAAPILPDAVRYLLAARSPRRGWASSYETAWCLLALTQALQGTADVQADYAYSATLDGEELASGKAATGSLEAVEVAVGLDQLRPGAGSELRIRRESGSGRLYYRSFLQLYQPVQSAEPVSKGVNIERRYYLADQDCRADTCSPQDVFQLDPGTQVLVRLTLTLSESMNYLVVEDFIPAGAEVLDPELKTTPLGSSEQEQRMINLFDQGWNNWYFAQPRIYEDRIWWAAQHVPAGTYELTYRLLPLYEGEFHLLPAHAYSYYFPDIEGTSGGGVVAFRRINVLNGQNQE